MLNLEVFHNSEHFKPQGTKTFDKIFQDGTPLMNQ